MINFDLKDGNAQVQHIRIPDYINLSLADVINAWKIPGELSKTLKAQPKLKKKRI